MPSIYRFTPLLIFLPGLVFSFMNEKVVPHQLVVSGVSNKPERSANNTVVTQSQPQETNKINQIVMRALGFLSVVNNQDDEPDQHSYFTGEGWKKYGASFSADLNNKTGDLTPSKIRFVVRELPLVLMDSPAKTLMIIPLLWENSQQKKFNIDVMVEVHSTNLLMERLSIHSVKPAV